MIKDKTLFNAFVKVVATVDRSDSLTEIRVALLELNDLMKARGYGDDISWEEGLEKALGGAR